MRNRLTNRGIQTAGKGVQNDGEGLILRKENKDKGNWVLRFTLDKKRHDFGIGSWPKISLAEARKLADDARELIDTGENPIKVRKREAEQRTETPTVEEIIYAAYEAREAGLKGDKRAQRWLGPLKNHVIPKIGDQRVTEIDQNDITAMLRPIWKTHYPTAIKAANRLHIALKHAAASGLPVDIQAVAMAKILLGDSGHKEEHHGAMPWKELPEFYSDLGWHNTTRRILSFLILTGGGARTTPVREAKFSQIKDDVWTVPGHMMKGRKDKTANFRIPLSQEALELVAYCRECSDGEYLFPTRTNKPISDVSMSKYMRENAAPYKPHGFRSTFREWLSDIGTDFHLAEVCIAHNIGTEVTRAYLRNDFLERRRPIMDQWSRHVLGEESGSIIQMK